MERQFRGATLAVLVVLASLFDGGNAEYRPVVLLHGLASESSVMETLKGWIQADFPGTTPCPRICGCTACVIFELQYQQSSHNL